MYLQNSSLTVLTFITLQDKKVQYSNIEKSHKYACVLVSIVLVNYF